MGISCTRCCSSTQTDRRIVECPRYNNTMTMFKRVQLFQQAVMQQQVPRSAAVTVQCSLKCKKPRLWPDKKCRAQSFQPSFSSHILRSWSYTTLFEFSAAQASLSSHVCPRVPRGYFTTTTNVHEGLSSVLHWPVQVPALVLPAVGARARAPAHALAAHAHRRREVQQPARRGVGDHLRPARNILGGCFGPPPFSPVVAHGLLLSAPAAAIA